MYEDSKLPRRSFLKKAAGALGATAQLGKWPGAPGVMPHQDEAAQERQESKPAAERAPIVYPRSFRGRQLQMVSFPLGGVAAGSLGFK
jgi:hypothetical protein